MAGNVLHERAGAGHFWSGGTAQTLTGLGGSNTYANAVNDHQQVAGMSEDSNGDGRAVVYSGGSATDVSLPGSAWSAAYAINNAGAIAGTAMDPWYDARRLYLVAGRRLYRTRFARWRQPGFRDQRAGPGGRPQFGLVGLLARSGLEQRLGSGPGDARRRFQLRVRHQ